MQEEETSTTSESFKVSSIISGEARYSWSKKEKETFPEQIDNKKDLLRTMSSKGTMNGLQEMIKCGMETKNSNGVQIRRDTGNTYRRVRHN